MSEPVDQLVADIAARIEREVSERVMGQLEQFVRSNLELTLSETEAARLLNVEESTLAAARRAGQVNHYRYGKSATYGLHHLQAYLARHEVRRTPQTFAVKTDVNPFGVETERRLRKVG